MARVCPLFSGSNGNSTYIKDGNSSVLVDAGASFKQLSLAVESVGGDISSISGVFVTHEHGDHIKGLKVLLKKTGAPLIASETTLITLQNNEIIPPDTECIVASENFSVGNFGVVRFATSHDCEGSSGYKFILPSGQKVSVCTDLGFVSNEVRSSITGSDCILLESNHDVEMLKRGPYPAQLKLRILSDKGHLSNNACAAELPELLNSGTTRFILGHLSLNNNLPMLAVSAARACLSEIGAERDRDYILTAAKPSSNGVTAL